MATIQLRRDSSTAWTAANPVLAAGEVGVDLTANAIRVGDGTSTWSALHPLPVWSAYDIGFRQTGSTRAAGAGDLPGGLRMARAVVLTSVTYRGDTADASGSMTVELRRNAGENQVRITDTWVRAQLA